MKPETEAPPPGLTEPRLVYLADEPQHLPTVARWLHEEWGHMPPGSTLEDRYAELERQMQRDAMPLAIVAVDGGRPVGFAALVDHQPTGLPAAAPRLANVYVTLDHRRHGLGSRLSQRIAKEAARLGQRRLYLYANEQETLYARLGWRTVERCQTPGWGETLVMLRELG